MLYTKLGKWALIDIETTGLNPDDSEIIDVGIICYEEKIYEGLYRFNFLPKNSEILPDWLTALTGLTIEDLSDREPIEDQDKWEKICELLKDRTLIAHNADFERKFLQPKFDKYHGSNWSLKFVDSLEFIPILFPNLGKYGLEYLLSYGGIASAEIHRGLEDSQDLLKVLLFYSSLFNQNTNLKRNIDKIFLDEKLSWWKVFLDQSSEDFLKYAESISFKLDEKLRSFKKLKIIESTQPVINVDFSKEAVLDYLNSKKECDDFIKKVSLKICQVLKNNLYCFYQCTEKLMNDEATLEAISLIIRSFKSKVLILSVDENRDFNTFMQNQQVVTVNQFLLKHFLAFNFRDEKLIAIQKSQKNRNTSFFFLPEFLRYESSSIDEDFNSIYYLALEDWFELFKGASQEIFFIQSRDLEFLPAINFGHHFIFTEKPNWEYSVPLHYQHLHLAPFFMNTDFYEKYFSDIFEGILSIRKNQTFKQTIFSMKELEMTAALLKSIFQAIFLSLSREKNILQEKLKYFLDRCENEHTQFFLRAPLDINENSLKNLTFFCEDHYFNYINPSESSAFLPSWYFSEKSSLFNAQISMRDIPLNKQFNPVQQLNSFSEEKLSQLKQMQLYFRFQSFSLESDDFIKKIFPTNLIKPRLVLFLSSDYQVSVPFYNYLKKRIPAQVKTISELRSEESSLFGQHETVIYFSWEKNSYKKSDIQKMMVDYPWDVLIFDKIPDISWGYLEQELWKKHLQLEASKGEDTKLIYWKKRAELFFHRVASFILNDKKSLASAPEIFIVDQKMLNWKSYTKNQFMEAIKIFFKGSIKTL